MNVAELEVANHNEHETKQQQPLLKFSATILMTIDKTVPLYFKQLDEAEDESFVAPPTPRTGELLFPSFNVLIPTFVEQIIPNLNSLATAEVEVTVGTFYDMLLFAFNTQMIQKQLPRIMSAGHNKKETLAQLFSASKEESGHKPYLLGGKSSKTYDKQKQELVSSKRFA